MSNKERIQLIENCNVKCEEIIYGGIPLINMKYSIRDKKTICRNNNNKSYSIIDVNNLKEYKIESGENPILSKIYGSKKNSLELLGKESSARVFIHNENVNEINDILEKIIVENILKEIIIKIT